MNKPDFNQANEIECARCGERFPIDLTRCPKCGASVYPTEGEEGDWQTKASDWTLPQSPMREVMEVLRALGWLAVGWLVAVILTLSLYIPLRSLVFRQLDSLLLQALIFVCAALGAAGGGFLVGRLAGMQGDLLGPLAGALNLLTPLILNAHEFGTPLNRPLGVLLGGALVILAAWLATRLGRRLARQALVANLFSPPEAQTDTYQDLLEKVGHDHATAERLIDYERRRNPDASRSDWIRAAISRWQRDNR